MEKETRGIWEAGFPTQKGGDRNSQNEHDTANPEYNPPKLDVIGKEYQYRCVWGGAESIW